MASCPVCSFPLSDAHHGSTRVQLCRRCQGALVSAQGVHEAYGALGPSSQWPGAEIQEGPLARQLRCPGDGAHMKAIAVMQGNVSVVVDVCTQCDALWLDASEGAHLARLLGSAGVERSQPGFRSYLFQLFTGMPVEVWHPTKKRPVLVYSLLALLPALFLLELTAIGAMGDVSFVQMFGLVPRAFISGERVWTLFTHGFIHGGWFHLLGNLYFLYVFGDNVEDTMGRRAFVQVYMLAMVAGGVLEVVVDPTSSMPRLGASGAIAGLMGAYLVLFPSVKVWVVWLFMRFKLSVWIYLGLWVLMQVGAAAAHAPGVAWFCHLGGFAAGAALGFRYRLRRSA